MSVEYFGKGCEFFRGQWENLGRDPNVEDNEVPVLVYCTNEDNNEECEGNCREEKCPKLHPVTEAEEKKAQEHWFGRSCRRQSCNPYDYVGSENEIYTPENLSCWDEYVAIAFYPDKPDDEPDEEHYSWGFRGKCDKEHCQLLKVLNQSISFKTAKARLGASERVDEMMEDCIRLQHQFSE